MTRIRSAGKITFAALAIPNYRLYFAGQAVSVTGTWMQMTAQAWLVLSMTHSAPTLGLIVALQTLPVLLLTPYGGVIADRVEKRKVVIALQAAMGVQALILGVLTVTGAVTLWEIGVLATLLGVTNAFENPARQSFMLELVGSTHLRNAVTLNSVMVNGARLLGPAIGGILIATVGVGACFLINSASFVAVIASLLSMDRAGLRPVPPTPRASGQLREGLRYVRSNSGLAVPLLMMAAVGCLTYEFQVTLPYMAMHGLHVGPRGFGFMTAAMGAGAVVGGLVVAARGSIGTWRLVLSAAVFGVTMTLAALAPTLGSMIVALTLVGASNIAFMSTGNATLQLRAAPEMRGRVMSLWFVAFQGSTPIGGPIVGFVMAALGARAGLGLGAVTCLVVAAAGAMFVLRRRGALGSAAIKPAADVKAAVDAEATAQALVDSTVDVESGAPAFAESGAPAFAEPTADLEAAALGPTALTRERPPRRSATAAAHHQSERASSAR